MTQECQTDFHAHLLNQLSRHLTAYDLVTFHHRGANFPDALLMDEVVKRHLNHASFPEYFLGDDPRARIRRRALRQGCLTRRHYECLPVPDLPTSPGENARVLPASHPRVPDEQITQTHRRLRRLFQGEPLSELIANNGEDAISLTIRFDIRAKLRAALEQSIRDLEHLDERVEMGLGLFIDRPLGYGKEIGEPDQTPLLAHEAFSPSLARGRWQELKSLCTELNIAIDTDQLDALFADGPWPDGLPHAELGECPRPTAALADVRKVADDFVILRTLPGGLARMLDLFDWQPLQEQNASGFPLDGTARLCVQTKDGVIAIFDEQFRRRIELRIDASQGFATRAGVEWPRAGLSVCAAPNGSCVTVRPRERR
jgi:hypothetical protein